MLGCVVRTEGGSLHIVNDGDHGVSAADTSIAAIVPLARELLDLKRITSANRAGSIAARLFLEGWCHLAAGASVISTMQIICARSLAACRLGDLDCGALADLGVERIQSRTILKRSFDEVAGGVDPVLSAQLRASFDAPALPSVAEPQFCSQLARQPRAGVTCPGRARLILTPAENHAEHCLTVAVIGALVSPIYGADPARAFLVGMSHHLHNAVMPDSGFTGEMLLGDALEGVIAVARAKALTALPDTLSIPIRAGLDEIVSDRTATARAFHAADVLDRVLEIGCHLQRGDVTMTAVLEDYELVHAGPVKAFHDRVLVEAGLK